MCLAVLLCLTEEDHASVLSPFATSSVVHVDGPGVLTGISPLTVPRRTCKCGRRVALAGLVPRATLHVNSATAFAGSNWQPAGVPFELR